MDFFALLVRDQHPICILPRERLKVPPKTVKERLIALHPRDLPETATLVKFGLAAIVGPQVKDSPRFDVVLLAMLLDIEGALSPHKAPDFHSLLQD
jgi:hypothetical protein